MTVSKDELKAVSQTDLKELILDLMRNTVSDESGAVPPEFAGRFDSFAVDAENFPYLQTLVGLVTMEKDAPLLQYSANFGYNAEQIAIEVANLTKLAVKSGWDIKVIAGHFVTQAGQMLMGTEGYKAFRFYEESQILYALRQRAESAKKPELIVPESKIILPN